MEKRNFSDELRKGMKLHKEGNLEEAQKIYEGILEMDCGNANALHLLGLIFYSRKNYAEAVKKIEKAISLKADCALFYGNLGMVYDAFGKEERAAQNFLRALEIDANYNKASLAHYNLGIYFKECGDFEKAIDHYTKAIEIDPGFYDARWNRTLMLLLLGNFNDGWKDYDSRFRKKDPVDSRVFSKPRWDGSDLGGKRILVLSEQGLGDNIQFVRYLSLVEKKGGKIILECRDELRKLFEQFSCVEKFVRFGDDFSKEDFDYYCYLLDLPEIFETDLNTIPLDVPYIRADKKLVENFKIKFDKDKFKIGIVWAGNPEHSNDKNRSITFEDFKFLEGVFGVKVYSLQKGKAASQFSSDKFVDLNNFILDFSDTAGVLDNLDLIISVDTAVVHLAGAMGKPVWVLLPFVPDWRWLINRRDSLWYPSTRLFRQKSKGIWKDVFEEVKRELGDLLEK